MTRRKPGLLTIAAFSAVTLSVLHAEEPKQNYVPVVTPNGSTLPYTLDNGVKVFHLTAEPVKREFAPGLSVECWGYNGQTPGPTLEAVEGDRVRIYVTNKLKAPTSVHWHGIFLPNGMDGVSGLTQKPIQPGETFKYEFTLKQHGTFMYHPHYDEMTQMGMGMEGFFIIHPKEPHKPEVDRDFAIFLAEWYIPPGGTKPDPSVMVDFNYFTFNSKVFPATAPLVAKKGQRVRIRLANLSMDNHPIHLHGFTFKITGTTGARVPENRQAEDDTVDVPPGSTRDFEFVADEPGDWAFHCHKTHHTMSGMGHGLSNVLDVKLGDTAKKIKTLLPGYMEMGGNGMGEMMDMGGPKNMITVGGIQGPFGTVDMGGMFTIVKVRDGIGSYEDPGWYKHPEGTVAGPVSESEVPKDPAPGEKPAGHE
ncbi:MAG: copper oxidase [Planctomycetes bacterium]|nr:copper oxidase [Planctomycetota bacterium]